MRSQLLLLLSTELKHFDVLMLCPVGNKWTKNLSTILLSGGGRPRKTQRPPRARGPAAQRMQQAPAPQASTRAAPACRRPAAVAAAPSRAAAALEPGNPACSAHGAAATRHGRPPRRVCSLEPTTRTPPPTRRRSSRSASRGPRCCRSPSNNCPHLASAPRASPPLRSTAASPPSGTRPRPRGPAAAPCAL